MRISKLNISEPLCYFKSGQFHCTEGWKHKHMCLDGDYEIILGCNKVICLLIDGAPYEIRPGDVVTIPPYVSYEGNLPSENEASFYWLHFFPRSNSFKCTEEQLLEEMQDTEKKVIPETRTASNFTYLPLIFHSPSPEKLFILMRQILDIANSNYYSRYCVDYSVTSFAMEITEQYRQFCITQSELCSEATRHFSQMSEWIRINSYKNLTVQDIADKFSFNPDYLTRLFKKNLGMGPKQYMNIQRINIIKGLLSTTNLSVKEITYLLNFKDEKYVMRLFKNIEGITISQYRNAYTNTYLNNLQVDPDIPLPKDSYTNSHRV